MFGSLENLGKLSPAAERKLKAACERVGGKLQVASSPQGDVYSCLYNGKKLLNHIQVTDEWRKWKQEQAQAQRQDRVDARQDARAEAQQQALNRQIDRGCREGEVVIVGQTPGGTPIKACRFKGVDHLTMRDANIAWRKWKQEQAQAQRQDRVDARQDARMIQAQRRKNTVIRRRCREGTVVEVGQTDEGEPILACEFQGVKYTDMREAMLAWREWKKQQNLVDVGENMFPGLDLDSVFFDENKHTLPGDATETPDDIIDTIIPNGDGADGQDTADTFAPPTIDDGGGLPWPQGIVVFPSGGDGGFQPPVFGGGQPPVTPLMPDGGGAQGGAPTGPVDECIYPFDGHPVIYNDGYGEMSVLRVVCGPNHLNPQGSTKTIGDDFFTSQGSSPFGGI